MPEDRVAHGRREALPAGGEDLGQEKWVAAGLPVEQRRIEGAPRRQRADGALRQRRERDATYGRCGGEIAQGEP